MAKINLLKMTLFIEFNWFQLILFVEISLENRYLQKNGTCNHKWPFCAKIFKTKWKNQGDQTGFHKNAL